VTVGLNLINPFDGSRHPVAGGAKYKYLRPHHGTRVAASPSPLVDFRPRINQEESPARAGLMRAAGRLFRRYDLFDRRLLSVGLLGRFIRLGQELIDHASTLLLLYPSLLRSLLFGPEFVIYFPAH
jgi:hypothetical protein